MHNVELHYITLNYFALHYVAIATVVSSGVRRMLREREDTEIERALQLSVNTERKRGCCGRK